MTLDEQDVQDKRDTWRRQPLYLLLDCSAAQAGVHAASLLGGVQHLRQQLAADPVAAACVYLGAVAYGGTVRQTALAPLADAALPDLAPGGPARLGAALARLAGAVALDAIPARPGRPGDRKPLVLALLRGAPADAWEAAADALAERVAHGELLLLGLAAGDAACDALRRLGGISLATDGQRPEALPAFCAWAARVVSLVCRGAPGDTLALPPLPPGIVPL